MQAYPHYFKRSSEVLDGLWDFCFLGETTIPDSLPTPVECNDVMMVPGVFDVTPAYIGKRGVALYRRMVNAPADRRIKLRIGGLGIWSKVFWDGHPVGTVDLPYSGVELEFDSGKGNRHELVFLIDNRFDFKRSPLFSQYYDFYAYGGLYRSVELHVLPECSFGRIQVKTLDLEKGMVSLTVDVSGKVPDKLGFELAFDDGEYRFFEENVVNGKIRLTLPVPRFKLWSTEHPNLHTVSLRTGSDGVTERFGIRTVSTGGGRILLNGKPLRLVGFCRHESHPEFGPVQPLPLLLEDLQNLRELGCNFIRGTHYPQDQRFLDLCDRMGFLVWEESLAWGNRSEQLTDPGFRDAQLRQTRQMVKNSFNHPSVILWGVMNEGPSYQESSREFYVSLFDAVRSEDSTRPVTYAALGDGTQDALFDLCDVISLNNYPGWYALDREKMRPLDEIEPSFERFVRFLEEKGFADKPFLISETGAGAIYGWRDRLRAHWSEEYQADYLGTVCEYVRKTPRVAGISLWHFADARTYTSSYALGRPRTINDKGILDEFRRPKLAFDVVKKAFPLIRKADSAGES